jgi:hypothetical protein
MDRDQLIADLEDQECKPLPGWACLCLGLLLPVGVGALLLAVRIFGVG